MKKCYLFFAIVFAMPLLGFSFLIAQSDCASSNSQIQLNVNNVNATLLHSGSLWWNGSDAGYEVPQGNSVHSIFAGGLWLGGFDASGVLRLAGQTYGASSGQVDFWPGPLDDQGQTTSEQCSNYDRFWETNSTDIESFLSDWADGSLDDPVPNSILGWPATGNPHFFGIYGFELPSFGHPLAPFIDVNADGAYDPENGDYPDVHQADQAMWWVFNDAGNVHTETGGAPLRAEIQMLAYSYETNDPVNDVTFYDVKLLNYHNEMIDSMYMGLLIDPDLGCHVDDYIGCYPSEQLGFVYNSDAVDGDVGCTCPAGVNTYCEAIPLVGIKFLKGTLGQRIFDDNGELVLPPPGTSPDTLIDNGLSHFMYYSNSGINPAPGQDDPSSDVEHYNYLSGSWRDGTPLTTGGSGYNPGSTDYVDHAFSGSPEAADDWSMCVEEFPQGDYRVVMSSGPFQMQPGAINSMSFAVVFVPNIDYPCPSVSNFEEALDAVDDLFDQMVPTKEIHSPHLTVNAIPNPFTDQTQLFFPDLRDQVDQVQLFSVDGRLVRQYLSVPGNSLSIDRGGLCDGMYFYKVITRGQRYVSGKLVLK